jgi:hypothetical protein
LIKLYAGIQEDGSTSCSQTESVIIVVTLPMSKADFIASEDKYIESVATTANVTRKYVKVLSIDEISTRSSRNISGRLLLVTAVRVLTSVLIAIGQHTNITDESVLNRNLIQNGLPHGTLVVQRTSSSVSQAAINASALNPDCSNGSGFTGHALALERGREIAQDELFGFFLLF